MRLHIKIKSKENRWTYKSILRDKAKRLLFPGLIFSIVAFIMKLAFPYEVARIPGVSLKEVLEQYLYPYENPMRELWFIITLFWFFLLTPVWELAFKNKWYKYVTMLGLVFLHFYHPKVELLCLGRAFDYAIWFYLGLYISKENLVDVFLNKNPLITFVIGIVIYLFGTLLGTLLGTFITTIGGIILSFGLALLLDRILPQTFHSFRNYTYQIFLIGIFAQMMIKFLYRHIEVSYILAYIMCIVVGIYVPVILSKILEKINCKLLLLCVGLKNR